MSPSDPFLQVSGYCPKDEVEVVQDPEEEGDAMELRPSRHRGFDAYMHSRDCGRMPKYCFDLHQVLELKGKVDTCLHP